MENKKNIKYLAGLVILLVGLIIGGFRFFEKIDNGYVGVRYSMNGGVKDNVLGQGVKFVGLDKVTQYPIRLQTVKVKKLNLATQDGKATHVSITYAYKVDPTKVSSVFKEFGNIKIEDIEESWLKAQLLKSGRKVMSEYNLLDVTGKKSTEVQNKILEDYQSAVKKKGFLVEDLSFGVPDVDAETKKSIDAIIKAGQDNERAKLEAETTLTKAKADAEAEVTRATAEAEANNILNNSITDNLIKMKEADAHMKHGFVTVQTGNAIVDTTTK